MASITHKVEKLYASNEGSVQSSDVRKDSKTTDPGGFEPPTARLTVGCSAVELEVTVVRG